MAIIGTAYVNIRAVTSQLEKDIQKQLSGSMRNAGSQAGKDINEGIRSQTSKMELGSDSINTKKATDKAAKDVKADLSKLLKEPISLGEFQFNTEAASRNATQKLVDDLNRNLRRSGLNVPAPTALPGAAATPDPEATAADFINRFRARLNAGDFALPEPDVSQAAEGAGNKFTNDFSRTLRRTASNTSIDIEPKVNTNKVKNDLQDIVRAANSAGNAAGDGFLSGFGKGDISSYLQRIFYQILFGIPIVGALVSALSSLVAGLFSVASAAAPAANALAILPGIFAAVGTAAIAGGLAFNGLGAAYNAGTKAISGAAGGAAKSVSNNADQIADATEAVARAQEAAAERVADAQRNVADAYESAREAIVAAQRQVADAERDLAEAQADSLDAQLAVNKAREEARENLIELAFDARQAAISEGRAAIELERAREKLQEVSELPVNHRLRREAQLNYDQAVLNLEEATKKNSDAASEQEEAQQKGIEGSDAVVEAREAEAEAAQAVLDAQQELADSAEDMAKTRVQAARDIQDAETQLQRTIRDGQRSVADAQKNLARAMRDTGAAAGGAAGGVDQFAQAMEKLSPAAQQFVRYLISIKGEFDRLRDAAGVDLFPRLETALRNVIGSGFLDILATGLQTAGRAIGDVAIRISELTADPFFQGSFANVMASNETVLGNMGASLVNLISLFTTIADAARPFTEEFTAWIATITGNWASQAQGNFSGLQASIANGVEVAKQLGDIFGGIIDAIRTLADAAQPAGQGLLDSFQASIDGLNEFLEAPGRAQQLQTFFADAADNFRSLSSLIAEVAGAFLALGDDPAVGQIAESFRGILPIITDVLETVTAQVGPHLAEVVGQVVGVFGEIASSGGINAFLDVIGTFADVIMELSNIPGFSSFVATFAVFIGTMKGANFITQALGLRNIGKNLTDIKNVTTGAVNGVKDFINGFKGIRTYLVTDAGQAETAMSRLSNGIRNLPGNIRNAAGAAREFATQQAALVRQQAGAARAFAVDGIKRFGDALKVAGAASANAARQMGVWIATQARAAAATAITTARIIAQRVATVAATVAQNAIRVATAAWTAVQWLLNAALSANPLGIIVIAITAVIAAIVLLWQNSETFRNIVIGVWEAVQTAISAVASWFSDTLVPWIQGVWESITNGVQEAWDWILNTIKGVGQAIMDFFLNWTLLGIIISNWDAIKNAIMTAWNAVWAFIVSVGNTIAAFFVGLWNGIRTVATTVWNGIVTAVTTIINGWANIFRTVFTGVSNFLSGLWNGIRTTAVSIWNGIVSSVAGIARGFGGTITGIFQGIRDGIANIWNGLGSIISGAVSGLLGIIRGPVNGIINAVNGVISNINGMNISIPDWVPGLGGKSFGINLPRIPQLALGGTVAATPGGVLANIAEAGRDERVTPLDANGMSAGENAMLAALREMANGQPRGNIVINLTAPAETDLPTLARMVSREIAFQES